MRLFLAAVLALSTGAIAAVGAPRSFTFLIDPSVTSLTVKVSGKGRICGPVSVVDSAGRVLVALEAGQCLGGGT